jgi:putative hydrolase of the HAD superfamily
MTAVAGGRVPHVVWDMGGIMYRYFTEVIHDTGRDRGWPVASIPLGPAGDLPDADYERMRRGAIDEPEYARIVARRLRDAGIEGEPLREIRWSEQARRETWATVRRIHDAGFKQAILTNDASAWLGERWWETWEAARWFDATIDVATLGVRKPAPEPYMAAAAALGVDPTECLFVDDMPVNCMGAEAVGMASLLFDVGDPPSSLRRLEDALGL